MVVHKCGIVAGVFRNIEKMKKKFDYVQFVQRYFNQSMNLWRAILAPWIYALEKNTNFSVPT